MWNNSLKALLSTSTYKSYGHINKNNGVKISENCFLHKNNKNTGKTCKNHLFLNCGN